MGNSDIPVCSLPLLYGILRWVTRRLARSISTTRLDQQVDGNAANICIWTVWIEYSHLRATVITPMLTAIPQVTVMEIYLKKTVEPMANDR